MKRRNNSVTQAGNWNHCDCGKSWVRTFGPDSVKCRMCDPADYLNLLEARLSRLVKEGKLARYESERNKRAILMSTAELDSYFQVRPVRTPFAPEPTYLGPTDLKTNR